MIVLDHVCFGYADNPIAIQNISLKISHGDSIGVIGANGAGKSTLLQLTAGLIIPNKGSIILDGIPVHPDNIQFINRKVGYVRQANCNSADATVKQFIADAPKSCGFSKTDVQFLTAYALKTMQLNDLANRQIQALSQAQLQAVAIAAVLAKQPDVMLLDDPSAFLDAKAKHSLINNLQTLHHTKILATHDLDLVLALCAKVIVLKEGGLYAYGSSQTLLRNVGLLQACNLELPLSAQKYNKYAYQY